MIFANTNRDKLQNLWVLINAHAKCVKYIYLPVFLFEMDDFISSGISSVSSS